MDKDRDRATAEGRRGFPPPPGRPTPLPDVQLERRYSLPDLERETGVSGRTIRYYITEGLLPPAYGRGPSATYDLGHLLRLQHIANLREQKFSLKEIRERLAGLTNDDIATILNIQTEPTEDLWRRIELHPDIELHVRQRGRSDPAMEDTIKLLIGLSRPVIEQLENQER